MLSIYNGTPFLNATEMESPLVLVGDGTTTRFALPFPSYNVSPLLTVGGVLVTNFTIEPIDASSSTLVFISPPPPSANIVVLQIQNVLFQAFDETLNGNSLSDQRSFYLIDTETIGMYSYDTPYSHAGIQIGVVNIDTSGGAVVDWVQFAAADVNGNPLSYGSAGANLTMSPIAAVTTLISNPAALSTSMSILSSTGIAAGDFIQLNPGQPNREDVKVLSISGDNITNSALQYTHRFGEPVYLIGRKFFALITYPTGAGEGQNQQYINLALQFIAKENMRF